MAPAERAGRCIVSAVDQRFRQAPLEAELAAHAILSDGVQFGVARIEAIIDTRLFAFREDGQRAVIVPVVEFGVMIDIVAVPPRPSRCLLRLGDATMLGGDNLDRARLFNQRPVIVEGPMDWLARPDSVCILDIERDAVEALADAPPIRCATLRLGERIEAAFLRPRRVPAITVLHG